MCALFRNLECQLMTFQLKGFSLCVRERVGWLFYYFFILKRKEKRLLHLTESGWNIANVFDLFVVVNLYPVWNALWPKFFCFFLWKIQPLSIRIRSVSPQQQALEMCRYARRLSLACAWRKRRRCINLCPFPQNVRSSAGLIRCNLSAGKMCALHFNTFALRGI